MTTAVRDFSFSGRTELTYELALSALREVIKLHGFELLYELPLDQELERKVGLRSRRCTVLVVWSPFDAYQAVLSDHDGGLLVPFNITVVEHGRSTVIAATNHAALARNSGSVGVQILAQTLAKKVRRIFLEVALRERVPEYSEATGSVRDRQG